VAGMGSWWAYHSKSVEYMPEERRDRTAPSTGSLDSCTAFTGGDSLEASAVDDWSWLSMAVGIVLDWGGSDGMALRRMLGKLSAAEASRVCWGSATTNETEGGCKFLRMTMGCFQRV